MTEIEYSGLTKGMIVFDYRDIQELSRKYFGDELTERELVELRGICQPDKWVKVDGGGYEGCLAQLVRVVVSIIGLVRADRRGKKAPLSPDLLKKIDGGKTMKDDR